MLDQELQALLNQSFVGFAVYRDGRLQFINPRFAEQFGYSTDQLRNADPLDLVAPEDRPMVAERMRERLAGTPPVARYTFRGLRRDGSRCELQLHSQAIPGGAALILLDISEQRRLEHALRDNEARLLEITATLSEGVYVVDRHCRISFINAAAERMLGYTAPQLLGRDAHALLHPRRPDGSSFLPESCAVHRSMAGGQTQRHHEDYFLRHDGSWLPVSLVSSPILRDAQVVGAVVAFHDISERLVHIRALRESEARYRVLFNAGDDAVFVHTMGNRAGTGERFIEVNEIACARLGYTRDELLNLRPCDLDAPESTTDLHLVGAALMQQGHAMFEQMHVARDGRRIPVEINSHLLEMNGQALVVSVARDITERLQQTEALRQSEERFRLLFNSSVDAIFVHRASPDFHRQPLIEVNDAACRLLGYSREELLRLTPDDIHDPESCQNQGTVVGTLGAGGPALFERVLRTRDARRIPVEINAHPFSVEGERWVIAVARDITERKRAEARIQHLAHYDLLTDLPNRGTLMDRMGLAIEQARRDGKQVAILFLGLDGFKEVNDTYGHDTGDRLLCEVAGRLTGIVRGVDTVARLGGDEFVVLLTAIDNEGDAVEIGREIHGMLRVAYEVDGIILRLSASVGLSFYPRNGVDPGTLLKEADKAMYRAKRAGRDRILVAER